jgi:hypothetical protein
MGLLASGAAHELGTPLATPVGVAPTGFARLAHPDGELAVAAGAARAGALYVLSARSTGELPFRCDGPLARHLLPPVLRLVATRVLTVRTPLGRKARASKPRRSC